MKKIIMKYIYRMEKRRAWRVIVHGLNEKFEKNFTDLEYSGNRDLALLHATMYRDEICKQEGIPVTEKVVCRRSHNKTGYYYIYEVKGKLSLRGRKLIPNIKVGEIEVDRIDIDRYGDTVKRKTTKR